MLTLWRVRTPYGQGKGGNVLGIIRWHMRGDYHRRYVLSIDMTIPLTSWVLTYFGYNTSKYRRAYRIYAANMARGTSYTIRRRE